jgi:predicted anti-sigma-YlaC factor YlaD
MTKSCEEYELLITAYLDGESEDTDKRGVFLHVAECSPCRAFLESVMDMKMQAARENRFTAPASLDRSIRAGTKRRAASQIISRWWERTTRGRVFIPTPVAILLALCLLSGGAGIAYLFTSTPPPAKEVIEPVVFVKFPAVQIDGNADQQKTSVQ